jgi:serine/threonine protein kinase
MSETLPIGAQVAGYRISGTLGRGGMGFVYEAEHLLLKRKAALKARRGGVSGDSRSQSVGPGTESVSLDG